MMIDIIAILVGAYIGIWIVAITSLVWSRLVKDEWDREFLDVMFRSLRTVLTFGAIK